MSDAADLPTTDAFGPVRTLTRNDLPALKVVIDAVGLFPSDMLDAMTAGFLRGEVEEEFWLTYDDGTPVAVVYCTPERLTVGTWNMLLIAVHPSRQGQGIGARLAVEVERRLAARGGRILLVETSGIPEFERTRAFYRGLGYDEEARIREFYAPGEDKIVFRKLLS